MTQLLPQDLHCLLAPLVLDHLVSIAMAHKERGVMVDPLCFFASCFTSPPSTR